jgi:peptide/nickel transport system substrate-binding protein
MHSFKSRNFCKNLFSICLSMNLAFSSFPVLGISEAFSATPTDTLIIALESKPKSSDPRMIGADANSQYIEELRFLPVLSFNETGDVKNILAQKIEVVSPTQVKIQLKKGVVFANGKPLTAQDVKATYDFVRGTTEAPQGKEKLNILSPRKGAFDAVKEIQTSSDSEITFVLNEPDAAFVTNLVVGILPKEALSQPVEDLTGKGFESGPYVLKSNPNQDLDWSFEINSRFSVSALGMPAPQIPKLKFRVIQDSNTRFAALEKGDIDLIQNGVDADKVTELRKKGKFEIITRTALNTTYLGFNLKEKNFQNKNVRKAIAHAINKEEILKYLLQGLGEKAESMFPPSWPYFENNVTKISFDTKKAEQMLDDAGFKDPDGKGSQPRFKFTLKIQTNRERLSIAKAIAAQLKKVGIEMNIEMLEPATFQKQLSDGLVQAWIAPWTGYKDPDHLRFVFHSKQTPPTGANRGFFSHQELDSLLENGREQTNVEKRKEIYSKAQKIISEEMPYVFLWYKTSHAIVSKNVSGYKIYADGRYSSVINTTKK